MSRRIKTATMNKKINKEKVPVSIVVEPSSSVIRTSIANVPSSVIVSDILPFVGSHYNPLKGMARTLGGKETVTEYISSVKPLKNDCLEEIYRRYPFLPRRPGYIIVRPGLFEVFATDCMPDYPHQVGPCCFRIDYTDEILEQIFTETLRYDSALTFKKFLGVVKDVVDTLNTRPYSHQYNRFYLLIRNIVRYSPYRLNTRNIDRVMEILQDPRLMMSKSKIFLIGTFLSKMTSIQKQIEYIVNHPHVFQNLAGTRGRENWIRSMWIEFLSFRMSLPVTLVNRRKVMEYNTTIYHQLQPMVENVKKRIIEKFLEAMHIVGRDRDGWNEKAIFYVEDLLPTLPTAMTAVQVVQMLDSIPPTTSTLPYWTRMLVQNKDILSDTQQKTVIQRYMTRAMDEQHPLNLAIEIYRYLSNHYPKTMLYPILTRFVRQHNFIINTEEI